MKFFANKSIWKKIVIIYIIITLFSFATPKPVAAGVGGELMTPICDFFVALGDGVVLMLHMFIIGQDDTLIKIDLEGKDESAVKKTWDFATAGFQWAGDFAKNAWREVKEKFGGESNDFWNNFLDDGKTYLSNKTFSLIDFRGTILSLPIYTLTPDNIFRDNIPLFNVNFFEQQSDDTTENKSLNKILAGWYNKLMILAIVGMMSVLVYIGIRILISSTSSEKAKYKQLIMDWLVGMILIFTIHLIMIISNIFVEYISDFIMAETKNLQKSVTIEVDSTGYNAIKKAGVPILNQETTEETTAEANLATLILTGTYEDDGGKTIYQLTQFTDWMGELRLQLQHNKDNAEAYIGYVVLFLMMIINLCIFVWTFLKRKVYLSFLTIIAPLVALTYPIDKANDGKAQGFDMWLKEYIFNLLLQPLYLLLYSVLIGAAIEIAADSPIYAIVTFAFLKTAEKILKQMFNFGKASTPGSLSGVGAAALTMSAVKWVAGRGQKGGAKDSGTSGGGNTSGGSDSSGNNISTKQHKIRMDKNFENEESKSKGNSTSANDATTGTATPGNSTSANDATTGTATPGDSTSANDETTGTATPGSSTSANDTTTGTATPKSNTSAKNKTRKGPKIQIRVPRVLRGLGGVAGMKGRKFVRAVSNGKPIRKIGKLMNGAAVGAGLGMLGLAAGAVSGDPETALKYMSAGAAGGAALGSRMANSRYDKYSENIEAFKRGYYGETEYQKRDAKKNQNKMIKDENNIRLAQKELAIDKYKDAKERLKDMVPFYADNDIDNVKDMVKIEKIANSAFNGDEYAREKATMGYKISQQYDMLGKEPKSDTEILDHMKNTLGWSDEIANRNLRYAKEYNKAKGI